MKPDDTKTKGKADSNESDESDDSGDSDGSDDDGTANELAMDANAAASEPCVM